MERRGCQQADPSFRDDEFIQGASSAFSMVLQAFADGDLSTLRRLLAFNFMKSLRRASATAIKKAILVVVNSTVTFSYGWVGKDFIASVTVGFLRKAGQLLTMLVIWSRMNQKNGLPLQTLIGTYELDDPNWKP